MSPVYLSSAPPRSTTTSVTAVPASFVTSFTACAFVSRVTFRSNSLVRGALRVFVRFEGNGVLLGRSAPSQVVFASPRRAARSSRAG